MNTPEGKQSIESKFLNAVQKSLFYNDDDSSKDSKHESELPIKFIQNKIGNNKGEEEQVIYELQKEIENCKSFDMSVAFITGGGLSYFKQTLLNLQDKHIKGRILTTDYNTFTEPEALKTLMQFNNLEVKLYRCKDEHDGFHTKGYIFKHDDFCRVIIGSSNLTLKALTSNKEWNISIVGKESGELLNSIENEFEYLWNSPNSIPIEKVIDEYESEYKQLKDTREKAREILKSLTPPIQIKPNKMQEEFIKNLLEMYGAGKERVMLISATGTGKTYAAALAVKKLMQLKGNNPRGIPLAIKRVLFLVHREQIAKQALRSFSKIIGSNNGITYGICSGQSKQKNETFVFATIQTVSRDNHLNEFKPDDFDLIIIDEVHRAGACTYLKVMEYFKPKLWLGMTASPDRTDSFDIYSLFDHNIAYEIRLGTALEENLLCPFHYYGISDIKVGGLEIEGDKFLSLQGKAKHILEQAKYYGCSGQRVKGLIFCSGNENARELSSELNNLGLKTIALSGSDTQEKRNEAIEKLTSDNREDWLDYIITVDIFNEGVDIPELNQVIMLRPTVSPIIFIQQLGRGLRKAEGKEYVNILDFIANYKNNYLIPVALSGDNSYDKEQMRRTIVLGSKIIPGASTIEFDEIVKKKILKSIDEARTNDIALLKNSYHSVKFKLGRIPRLVDYSLHDGIDCIKFFQNNRVISYYNFLKDKEKEDVEEIGPERRGILEFLSKKVGLAKRVEEALLLEILLSAKQDERLRSKFASKLAQYNIKPTESLINSVSLILEGNFETTEDQKKANTNKAVLKRLSDGDFVISKIFAESLSSSPAIYVDQLTQLVEFAKQRYEEKYSDRYKDTCLVLCQTYTYSDVCRLLNWNRNLNAQNIGGYFFDKESKTLPVFINYNKTDDSIPYEDRFESDNILMALSKTNRTTDSTDRRNIYSPENKKYLFVRKNKEDDEAKSFYFLGEITPVGEPIPVQLDSSQDPNKKVPAFEVRYKLETPVRKDIFDYITGGDI